MKHIHIILFVLSVRRGERDIEGLGRGQGEGGEEAEVAEGGGGGGAGGGKGVRPQRGRDGDHQRGGEQVLIVYCVHHLIEIFFIILFMLFV